MGRLKLRSKSARKHRRSSTPNFDRASKSDYRQVLIRLIAFIGLPILLMVFLGQPAMRIQYRWNGDADFPVYSWCRYATFFNGTYVVAPPYGPDKCPLFATAPFLLSHLID